MTQRARDWADPDPCFICHRRAAAAVRKAYGLGWFCRDCGIGLAIKVAGMPQKIFDQTERKCLLAAGDAAGEYLDAIGKTDLAELEKSEWERFLTTLVHSFGDQMRKAIDGMDPPF